MARQQAALEQLKEYAVQHTTVDGETSTRAQPPGALPQSLPGETIMHANGSTTTIHATDGSSTDQEDSHVAGLPADHGLAKAEHPLSNGINGRGHMPDSHSSMPHIEVASMGSDSANDRDDHSSARVVDHTLRAQELGDVCI